MDIQPGDYVETAELTEEQFTRLAEVFTEAGAAWGTSEEPYPLRFWLNREEVLGWDVRDDSVYCNQVDTSSDGLAAFPGRKLDPAELLGE